MRLSKQFQLYKKVESLGSELDNGGGGGGGGADRILNNFSVNYKLL